MKNLLLGAILISMLCIPSGNQPVTATASPTITYQPALTTVVIESQACPSVDDKMLLPAETDCDPGIFIDIPEYIDDIVLP